jgi:N-sulfoglucosamine sulfohydrolase
MVAMARPNILYIHSHDTGRQIEPYGRSVPTPNLQTLAEGSIVFRKAFCAAPTCSPSRAALLTGQSPHSAGQIGLAHRGVGHIDPDQHIAATLREAGYTTALSGVQHVTYDQSLLPYDHLMTSASCTETETVAGAIRFLETTDEDEPFFLSVGFWDTHRPFLEPDDPIAALLTKPPGLVPDTPATRHDMAGFKASAARLDMSVGAVLDTLESLGFADNTLVICTTDHGIAFPKMKCNLTDHGMGVMLMMRWPERFDAGKSIGAMVSHVDVFPTVCELLEIDKPEWLQGNSMMPVITGDASEINEEIFGEVTFHAAYEPMRAVRTLRHKYIRRFAADVHDHVILPNCDDSAAKDAMLATGWADDELAREELYDLVIDPQEGNNLADDPAHAGKLMEMRRRLDAWMRRTDDPLLAGPVAPPSGAQLNDPDGDSPDDPRFTVP